VLDPREVKAWRTAAADLDIEIEIEAAAVVVRDFGSIAGMLCAIRDSEDAIADLQREADRRGMGWSALGPSFLEYERDVFVEALNDWTWTGDHAPPAWYARMSPRPLTLRERESLLTLLPDGGFAGVDEYRAQVEHAVVVGRCSCGCPSIDLAVDHSRAPHAPLAGTPLLPVEAQAREGDEHLELILFAPEGWLETLELVYYSDTPPAELPDPHIWQTVT
jgi:hypothetical protein